MSMWCYGSNPSHISSFRTLTTSCAPLRGGLILVRTLWFALLLAASLALVSCGDDDDDAGEAVLTTGTTELTTTVSTADPTTTEQRPSTTDCLSTPKLGSCHNSGEANWWSRSS